MRIFGEGGYSAESFDKAKAEADKANTDQSAGKIKKWWTNRKVNKQMSKAQEEAIELNKVFTGAQGRLEKANEQGDAQAVEQAQHDQKWVQSTTLATENDHRIEYDPEYKSYRQKQEEEMMAKTRKELGTNEKTEE